MGALVFFIIALSPGIAISLAVFGFNLFEEALRDVLDPKITGLKVHRLTRGTDVVTAAAPTTGHRPISLLLHASAG
jgi:hypothetical protein